MDTDELRALISSDSLDCTDADIVQAATVPSPGEENITMLDNGIQDRKSDSPGCRQRSSSWREDLNIQVFLLTILSGIGGFLFGYDTGVVSGAMLQIKDDQRINPNTLWTEMIISVTVGEN